MWPTKSHVIHFMPVVTAIASHHIPASWSSLGCQKLQLKYLLQIGSLVLWEVNHRTLSCKEGSFHVGDSLRLWRQEGHLSCRRYNSKPRVWSPICVSHYARIRVVARQQIGLPDPKNVGANQRCRIDCEHVHAKPASVPTFKASLCERMSAMNETFNPP